MDTNNVKTFLYFLAALLHPNESSENIVSYWVKYREPSRRRKGQTRVFIHPRSGKFCPAGFESVLGDWEAISDMAYASGAEFVRAMTVSERPHVTIEWPTSALSELVEESLAAYAGRDLFVE